MDRKYICCICNKEKSGWGNNPEGAAWKLPTGEIVTPAFNVDDYCCDECNKNYVIPGRLYQLALRSKGGNN